MSIVKSTINLLGIPVRDRVTGFRGTVTSVSFDLYGCVQATVDAGFNDKNERVAHWFDVARLEPTGDERVMKVPAFAAPDHGPADKGIGR